jgi:probable HAF family extracellular repeat protein
MMRGQHEHRKAPKKIAGASDRFWLRYLAIAGICLGALVGIPVSAIADAYTFTSIDFPGRSITWGEGINNSGQTVGTYQRSYYQGFTDTGGVFTTIDAGSSRSIDVAAGRLSTFAYGINNAGQVVGYTSGGIGGYNGFLLSGGALTTIDIGNTNASMPGTLPYGINDVGQIVGSYNSATGPSRGFIDTGGVFTTIDAAGLVGSRSTAQTYALGINNAGQVVGYAYDGGYHAFLDTAGVFTSISVPGSPLTIPSGINNSGQIVGYYYAPNDGGYHGFIDTAGVYTSIDVPGARRDVGYAVVPWTIAQGLNDNGQIVGYFTDATGTHEFVTGASGSSGPPDSVPEPSTITIFGAGILALGLMRARTIVFAPLGCRSPA